MDKLLTILIFFPFIAGLLVLGKPTKILANISMGLEFALCVYLAWYATAGAGTAAFMNAPQTESAGMVQALQISLPGICGFGLHFTMDGFRMIYMLIAGFMWFMTTLLSGEYFYHHKNVKRFYVFLLWTLGATMGVFLSADLYTTFIFFEIMSFTSYVWVAQEENRASLRAAETYLAVAVLGGLVMLMGIFLLYYNAAQSGIYQAGQPLWIESLRRMQGGQNSTLWIAGCCMLVGFGAKAGAFPLHIWLPKAHPVAPAPASALLSGILTKTGIYGILILSCFLFYKNATWGALILLLGVITMFGGALLAVFSIDLKRTLACSSMSQIGFILVGVGMQGLLGEENALAAHGTMLHMVNHSLIKLVLFMAAGVIYMNAHALDLNKIRGFGRKKPFFAAIFLTGALAIGGIPLFSGYVSKTLLHESIVEFGLECGSSLISAVEWIFLISGGLTVAYMTKLFVAVFIEKNEDTSLQEQYDSHKKYMNPVSGTALTLSAVVLFIWGLIPGLTMDKVAEMTQGFFGLEEFGHQVHYFSFANLKGGLISIAIGTAVYLLVIRTGLMKEREKGSKIYVDRWPKWLDMENLIYRPLLLKILPFLFGVFCRIFDSFADMVVVCLRKTVYKDSPLPHERREGNAFTAAIGSFLNQVEELGNHLWNRRKQHHVDYEHVLAMKSEEISENNRIIGRSLSFGLLLFGVGLALTLIYLILS